MKTILNFRDITTENFKSGTKQCPEKLSQDAGTLVPKLKTPRLYGTNGYSNLVYNFLFITLILFNNRYIN